MSKIYRSTKEQRKEWWNNLSDQQKSDYISSKERSHSDRKPSTQPPIVPLTEAQMAEINATMRRLGLEDQIVLPGPVLYYNHKQG